jgi:quinol monooxygenase YgiN
MGMYGLFGKMKAQPSQRDALMGHLQNGLNALNELDGCYVYVIGSDPDDADGIWISEVWRSREDHQASLNHEGIKSVIAAARPLIAEMSHRTEYIPVGGKGIPQK